MEVVRNEEDDTFEIVEEIVLDDENRDETHELTNDMEDMTVENEEDIVEDKDESDMTFTSHTAAVFCVSLDPINGSYAVSGGEDDKAFVWKIADGTMMFECEGHKDSVIAAKFSHDAKYVATGDMSGVLKVFVVDTGQEVWSFETSDLEWLDWHHSTNVLFAGTSTGELWMWKIPSGECKTYQGHGARNTCGHLLLDGKQMSIGYGDGTVKLWDLKNGSYTFHVSGGYAHEQSVTSLDINKDNTLIATGSEDSTVKLINIGNGKVVGTIQAGLQTNEDEDCSIESVSFYSSQPLLATASLSGALCVWDVTSQKLRHHCQHSAGVTQIQWDQSSPLIYSACLDGVLRLWDARSGDCEREWHGHAAPILDFDVSKDSGLLISSSDDFTVKTFCIIQPGR